MKSFKKMAKSIKETMMNKAKTIWGIAFCSYVGTLPVTAHATSDPAAAMKSGMNTLIGIASTAIVFIGAFIVLWGVFEMGNAMQSNDPAQQGHAGKRIAGGIIMVAGSILAKVIVNAVVPGTMQ